jgi:hypothetical protein
LRARGRPDDLDQAWRCKMCGMRHTSYVRDRCESCRPPAPPPDPDPDPRCMSCGDRTEPVLVSEGRTLEWGCKREDCATSGIYMWTCPIDARHRLRVEVLQGRLRWAVCEGGCDPVRVRAALEDRLLRAPTLEDAYPPETYEPAGNADCVTCSGCGWQIAPQMAVRSLADPANRMWHVNCAPVKMRGP